MDGLPRERAPGAEDVSPRWEDVADAVWLAAHRIGTGRTALGEPVPADDEDLADARPSFLPPPPAEREGPTDGGPRPVAGLSMSAPGPEAAPEAYTGPFVPPETRPHARGQGAHSAQLARALHRLAKRVPSSRAMLLDEELTAERLVVDSFWMPYLRPADTKAFDLVVLVDDSPTMAVWRDETAALGTAAEHSGAFRSVRTARLEMPHDGVGVPRLRWSAAGGTAGLTEILGGRGDRLFLVVTDGLGHGWAAAAADILLGRLGGAGPTALVHLLPPHMRHRSSLHPHVLELESGGFGAPNRNLGYRQPSSMQDPLRPLPETDGEATVVPVLSFKSGSLAAWADLVVGGRGVRRQLPAVLAGTLSRGTPALGLRPPRPPQAAAVAVRRFFNLATPAARRLATHLAAAPFEFDLVRQLRDRTMPDTGAEHLAEILMGGLIDWDQTEVRHAEFADGVREALLATTTRTQLTSVVLLLGELPAAGEHGVALRAALRDPAGTRLPDPSDRAWMRTELAVMRALSGPYSQRARLIEATGVSDFVGTVSSPSSVQDSSQLMSAPGLAAAPETAVEASSGSSAKGPDAPAVLVNVPSRNGSFVGRTSQLRALEDALAVRDVVCVLPPQPLHSVGVGASELALEYVHRHADDYDLVCWIPADLDSLILATLARLADPLGLGRAAGAVHAVDWAVPAVLEALRARAPYDRWLLVLDGADDIDSVRRYLPLGGSGKVLVTSRHPGWERVAATVRLDFFEREESVELLRKLSPALGADDADRLADALDDVPLAVQQAGVCHRLTGSPADEYLALLDERGAAVHELGWDTGCPYYLAAAWDIALERLHALHPDARRLLDVCAHLASEPVPLALLDQARTVDGMLAQSEPPPDDRTGLSRTVRALSECSLAQVDADQGALRLPGSLGTFVLAAQPPEHRERKRETAHRLLAAARPGSPSAPQEWPVYWSLLPHLLFSRAVTSTDPGVRALVYETVLFLESCGDRDRALALGRDAWTAWLSASGEENEEVLRMARTYASLLRRSGRIAESVPLTENALDVSRRREDPDDLIESLCGLADARRHQGRFQEARLLSEEAVELARAEFGTDDPVTLRAVHSWGADLRLCGRPQEALALARENARLADALFGPVDEFTLDSLNALAIDLRGSGDHPGARELQEDLYRRARSELGEEHRLTLRLAVNLTVCRRWDGALPEAAALSEETLWQCTSRYGSDHLESLAAAVNAAVDGRLARDVEWSRQLNENTVGRLVAHLGEDHLCTLAAKANLAAAQRAFGLLDEARELEDDVTHRLDETVGPRHPTALTVAIGRANTAYAGLDFERAREIDETHLPLLSETLGARHPLTLACTANLALDLRGLGEGAEADALQRTAVEGLTAVVGADHPWLSAARQRRRVECDLAYVPL